MDGWIEEAIGGFGAWWWESERCPAERLLSSNLHNCQVPPPVKINVITAPNWRHPAPTNLWEGPKRLIPGLWAPWRRWACPQVGCTYWMLQARPPAMVVACGRLWWPWRCGGGGGGRVGTRLGLVSGGSMAYTKPGHATAVGTQNPGRVCPREPFQQQRNHASEAVQICESAARARGQPRSIARIDDE